VRRKESKHCAEQSEGRDGHRTINSNNNNAYKNPTQGGVVGAAYDDEYYRYDNTVADSSINWQRKLTLQQICIDREDELCQV
jgi:hypothetical protein